MFTVLQTEEFIVWLDALKDKRAQIRIPKARYPPRLKAGFGTGRRFMNKTKSPLKLVAFDAARYLDDDEAIAEYMTAALEANDPDLLLLALSDVARAKGMAQVAKDAGLGRESLYKALAPK